DCSDSDGQDPPGFSHGNGDAVKVGAYLIQPALFRSFDRGSRQGIGRRERHRHALNVWRIANSDIRTPLGLRLNDYALARRSVVKRQTDDQASPIGLHSAEELIDLDPSGGKRG